AARRSAANPYFSENVVRTVPIRLAVVAQPDGAELDRLRMSVEEANVACLAVASRGNMVKAALPMGAIFVMEVLALTDMGETLILVGVELPGVKCGSAGSIGPVAGANHRNKGIRELYLVCRRTELSQFRGIPIPSGHQVVYANACRVARILWIVNPIG